MSFLQAGDIVNFGRLAWQAYEYGWVREFSADKNYQEFGADVRNLAANLEILSQVVTQAHRSLQSQGGSRTPLRWDPTSLREIIGDYDQTLNECVTLVNENRRYNQSSGAFQNIGWNVLVQPNVDRLRQRIVLHNSKVLIALKPFEIDLLSRVRQDIYRVHHDLAHRISAVQSDLRRLIGVLVPDLEQALEQQAHRERHIVPIPEDFAKRFRREALAGLAPPAYGAQNDENMAFALEDLANAFVVHFNMSTIYFAPGLVVADRVPPLHQYMSLMRCCWIMDQINESEQLQEQTIESHWPSYIRQLEDDLSMQCLRFIRKELVEPELVGLQPEHFVIWPEKEKAQILQVVTRNEFMVEVLELELQGSSNTIEQKVKLLRRMQSNNKRYRVIISGKELRASGMPRLESQTIDFDITNVTFNPLYVFPSAMPSYDMILRKDESIARLAFRAEKDALKFQQAVTGFKPYASYVQRWVRVKFVLSSRREPVLESGCLQLWIPKHLEGDITTNLAAQDNASAAPDYAASATTLRPDSVLSTAPTTSPGSRSPGNSMLSSRDPLSRSPPGNRRSVASPIPQMSPTPQRQSMAFSPQARDSMISQQGWYAPADNYPPLGNSPLGISGLGSSPPGSRISGVYAGFNPPPNQFNPQIGYGQARRATISTLNTVPEQRADRTLSISSGMTAVSNSSSSNSETYTATLAVGDGTGYLHKKLVKPMLVLFTQDMTTRRLSLVTIDVDEDTIINSELCDCRKAGREGTNCLDSSIQKRKGDLVARRFEANNGDIDWNVAKLAINRREEKEYADAFWRDVRRVTITFSSPENRALFGGMPNACRCKIKTTGDLSDCLQLGHKGMFGHVQEHWRKTAHESHTVRYESQKHVVKGQMRDDVRQ